MTLTYQRFTAALLIYGSLFLSGIYYCLRVFLCAPAYSNYSYDDFPSKE